MLHSINLQNKICGTCIQVYFILDKQLKVVFFNKGDIELTYFIIMYVSEL